MRLSLVASYLNPQLDLSYTDEEKEDPDPCRSSSSTFDENMTLCSRILFVIVIEMMVKR
jgi:hypothetical protein